MKFLIKKYLQFERQHGTSADIDRAKERITEYVTANDDLHSKANTEQDNELDF